MVDFTNSEYLNFINDIISSRGQWSEELDCWEGHHIIPISFGGEGYSKNKHPNVVRLTPGEHFEAHKLLALCFPEVPAFQQAFFLMANTFKIKSAPLNQRLIDISNEDYELARKLSIEAMKNNPIFSKTNKGRRVVCCDATRETRRLFPEEIDLFLKANPEWRLGGLSYTDEIRAKHKGLLSGKNNPMYGRKWTAEMQAKREETTKGKKWFTNGVDDIYCRPEDAPNGYYKGNTHYHTLFGKGENNYMWGKTSPVGKKVRCITTGEIFESKRKASSALAISAPMIDRSILENKPVKNKAGRIFQFEYVN